MKAKHYIVVGSSRGLGHALVEELLKNETHKVIGLARTKFENIKSHEKWLTTKRYLHVELDITQPRCRDRLNSICAELPGKLICLIINAGLQGADINNDNTINFKMFEEINRLGINGLYNIIVSFQQHLLTYGGILIGISSVSALIPPISEPRVAYPSSKAYLDMVLRCLRVLWSKKVKIVTIRLGHMRDSKNSNFLPSVPTYSKVASEIIRNIGKKKIPNEINYPFKYALMYKYIFTFFPDRIYAWLLSVFLKSRNIR